MAEVIEKAIVDRVVNSNSNAGKSHINLVIEQLATGIVKPDCLWKQYEKQATGNAINHATQSILVQDQIQGLARNYGTMNLFPQLAPGFSTGLQGSNVPPLMQSQMHGANIQNMSF